MEHVIDLDKKGHSSTTMQRLNSFRGNGQHCDFTIKVKLEEIPAHRNVLAAGSDYFNAMLSHDTLENQSGVVEIKEADAESVRKCIGFIYTGKISVAGGKYEQLMHVAHLFQLQQLCDEIAVFLEASLDAKSFFVTKKLANMYNCKMLEEKCDQFALENLEQISDADEFLQFETDYISFILKTKNLKESLKVDVLFKWVNFDHEKRSGFFMQAVESLDLSLIPVQYQRHLVEEEPLIRINSAVFLRFMSSILDAVHVKPVPFQSLRLKPDITVFDKRSMSLWSLNLSNDKWKQILALHGDMKTTRFSAVASEKSIYVLMQNKAVFRLDFPILGKGWKRMANMAHDHGNYPPAVMWKDCIYVVGGYSVQSSSVEKFEVGENKWAPVPDKGLLCAFSSSVALQDNIYSIGGKLPSGERLSVVERFSVKNSTWEFVAPMSMERNAACTVACCGKMYVIGGEASNGEGNVESYDPLSNVWEMLCPMLNAGHGFRAVCFDKKIYVVGGIHRENNIDEYDIEKNEWKEVSSLKGKDLQRHATVAI